MFYNPCQKAFTQQHVSHADSTISAVVVVFPYTFNQQQARPKPFALESPEVIVCTRCKNTTSKPRQEASKKAVVVVFAHGAPTTTKASATCEHISLKCRATSMLGDVFRKIRG